MAIIVNYNNLQLTPTPLVNRSISFLDYNVRYGEIEQITLNGFLTGIQNTGSIFNIVNIFSGQFKTLEVLEDSNSLYKWSNCAVEEISFPQSTLSVGGIVPYSVKIVSYNVPSGVIDPSNEYSFTQNQDNTVDVSHKISAKGIKNTIGALDNAVAFVKLFTGKNPYTNCSPAFVNAGSGIRLSVSENIDRLACTYSVTENYKYSSGLYPYIETTSISVNDSKAADYTTIGLDLKWQGSPIDKNLSQLQDAITGYNLNTILSNYGIAGAIYLNSFNISQNSGESTIALKAEYLSGVNNDISGYFDYVVSMDQDTVTSQTSWKVDGEFICKGPISFRKSRISGFKTANSASSYLPYLQNLVTTSAIYNSFHLFALNPKVDSLTISENTGIATLKLSASFDETDAYGSFVKPKYSVNISPSIWVYQSYPAANIEGHYIIQDLQMKKQAKMNFTFESETNGISSSLVDNAYLMIDTLSGIYVGNSFLINDTVTTGITNVNISTEILGQEAIQTDINSSKVYGSIVNSFTREQGFRWGY